MHFVILVIDHVSNLSYSPFFFPIFIFFFHRVIRAESARWLSGEPFAHACVSFVTFFPPSFLSSVSEVFVFFPIHSGLPFCHVDDCSSQTESFFFNVYRPVQFFYDRVFFLNWRNDYAAFRMRQFFPLSWNVSRFFCHDVFFRLQKCP